MYKIIDLLPPNYGYVLLTAHCSVLITMWTGINLCRARKKYAITAMAVYSDKSMMFNCFMRAHQSMLEMYPFFLYMHLIGGLVYPISMSISGLIFQLGRIAYALGYYTGEPNNRFWGSFGTISYFLYISWFVWMTLHDIMKVC
ncbi:hypothetical protein SNEBB_009852 [Seison nebaliae]|nr:hypothetical protein SNEBB_009852 [Seison nebaliae]